MLEAPRERNTWAETWQMSHQPTRGSKTMAFQAQESAKAKPEAERSFEYLRD